MELDLVCPAYRHPSQDVGNQELVNWFLSPSPQKYQTDPKYALLPVSGKRLLIDLGGNEVRAVIEINDAVYAVVDDKVYRLTIPSINGTVGSSLIGTITTSTSGRISWAANITQIMLVDGTSTGGYIITQATDTFAQITDESFTGGDTVVFIDGYFIYSTPNAQTMYATAINDGTTISALDVTSAEGSPDLLVGLAVDKRELWAFGKKTIEIWYDAANATGFPFSRRDGAYIDIGCSAAGSILNFDNTLVWLDNRGFIVRADGYSPQVISTPPISAAIASYSTVSDAKAFTHVDRGELFYIITFPSAGKTWAYGAATQEWHERAYFTPDGNFKHDLVNCQARWGNYDIIGLRNSGKVCYWDSSCYTDAGDPIRRILKTSHYQQDLSFLAIDCLELQLETGKSEPTDAEPFIVVRYSHDNGYTWSDEIWRGLGNIGDYSKSIRINRLGSGRKWQFEFMTHAPQKLSFIRANVDITSGK